MGQIRVVLDDELELRVRERIAKDCGHGRGAIRAWFTQQLKRILEPTTTSER